MAALRRPVFAVSLYMLTFFLLPQFWWWGDALASIRWNFFGGVILLIASFTVKAPPLSADVQRFIYISLAILANMTLVNFLIAGNSDASFEAYELTVKFLVLSYLMARTIQSTDDLKIALISILIGAAYIGFECMVNDRGDIVHNRLEGVGAPGATTANHFASLMITIMPLVAPFFLYGRLLVKGFAVCLGALIVNVVLLCNSRGAFLAAIFSTFSFVFLAPKEVRKKAIKLVAVGAFGVFLLLGDGRIVDRFLTTFASKEDRDNSSQSRLDFWQAGLVMIADYPIGAGGNGFKKVHGVRYLRKAGVSDVARAIHNGYLNEICQWGLQGLVLRLAWYYLAIRITLRSIRWRLQSDESDQFLIIAQVSMLTGIVAFLFGSLFGDLLDAEWGHWMVALMVAASLINSSDFDEDELDESSKFELSV